MTLEYSDLQMGEDYKHKQYGPGTFLGIHPHDGCSLLFEVRDDDEELDELGPWKIIICERHDLERV